VNTPTEPASPPTEPAGPRRARALSPAMRAAGYALLGLAAAGVVVHLVIYLLPWAAYGEPFARSAALKVSFGLSFATLAGNIFHYHRTHMRLDVASRILTYIWIGSIILFLRQALYSAP